MVTNGVIRVCSPQWLCYYPWFAFTYTRTRYLPPESTLSLCRLVLPFTIANGAGLVDAKRQLHNQRGIIEGCTPAPEDTLH
jgi:hypothetical protein